MNLHFEYNKKEYGGYLPLELPIETGGGYYSGKSVVKVDKGRSAILLAILCGGFKKVYVPYYTCPSISDFIRRESNVEVSFYNINKCFEPINVVLHAGECILWTNYFGLLPETRILKMIQLYRNSLIVDSTQGFFCRPYEGASFVYSCRKFFGVSDGGYLWKKDGCEINLDKDTSTNAIVFLAKAYEYGTNNSYQDYLSNEKRIGEMPIMGMSDFTYRILKSIDYDIVYSKRQENFLELDKYLGDVNELVFDRNCVGAPQVYPLLIKNESLRDHLVKECVYIPRWWKHVIIEENTNKFEKYLSKYLLPLPIDQRYNVEDMKQIAKIVLDFIGAEDGINR